MPSCDSELLRRTFLGYDAVPGYQSYWLLWISVKYSWSRITESESVYLQPLSYLLMFSHKILCPKTYFFVVYTSLVCFAVTPKLKVIKILKKLRVRNQNIN